MMSVIKLLSIGVCLYAGISRESGNGTYVAGVDTDRRDFRNLAPGNPGDI